MSKSIIQDNKDCYRCHTVLNLEKHHCLFGPYRKKAETDGLWVYLCHNHHTGDQGVHTTDPAYKLILQQKAQLAYMEEKHKTIEDFIERYGRNYL